MPHWRTFVSNDWFTAADLYDEKSEVFGEVVVKIDSVKGGELVGEGGRKTRRPIVTFSGPSGRPFKPLAVNSTNAKAISAIAGSEDTNRWVGALVCLFVTKTRDPQGGGQINCIRVKPGPQKPSQGATP